MLPRLLMDRRPLRVVMTADAVGGIWTYATDLAGALATRGVEVTLAVLGPGLDEAKRRAAAAGGLAVVDLGHPPEWLADGPDAVARGSAALRALARDVGADGLHLNHPALGAGGDLGFPTLVVCHSCVATWWAAVRGTPLPRDLAWQADLVAAGYRAAAMLVAPSRAFATATQEAYGLAQAPEVAFNGRAAAAIPREGPARAAGLTVGRLWDEGKDVATLDRAAASTGIPIAAAGPIAGPNGVSVALHHLAGLGPVGAAEVRALLADRPVFLSAARYEPFGLAVLEAAQAGCALVLSDIATFRELWDEAALFVPPGDAAGFAGALGRVVEEPSLRAGLGAAASARAARYTLAAAADRLAGLYATAWRGAGPRAEVAPAAPGLRSDAPAARSGEAA